MADMENKLNEMLSNPEAMKKVLDLASGLAGVSQNQAAPAAQADPAPSAPDSASAPDLSALFSMLGGASSSAPAEPTAQTAETAAADAGALGSLMDKVNLSSLPKLMDALSGKPNYLKPEKVNLLKALKPYLSASRAPNVDRAVKMANLAKAAQDALGGIIRR